MRNYCTIMRKKIFHNTQRVIVKDFTWFAKLCKTLCWNNSSIEQIKQSAILATSKFITWVTCPVHMICKWFQNPDSKTCTCIDKRIRYIFRSKTKKSGHCKNVAKCKFQTLNFSLWESRIFFRTLQWFIISCDLAVLATFGNWNILAEISCRRVN